MRPQIRKQEKMLPRGMKLKNPGNIRISNIPWEGKIVPSNDPDFETFQEIFYGIRAAAIIFCNYSRLDGLSSIAQFIGRWAPSSDANPTTSYTDFVATACGYDPNNSYNVLDPDLLARLLEAIFRFEQGSSCISAEQIQIGVEDALDSFR
jgi:hypothetical protein